MQNAIFKAVQTVNTVNVASEQSSDNQSVVILITGFVVVFLVLLLLIGIIKIYSAIVYAAQKKSESKQTSVAQNNPLPVEVAPETSENCVQDDLQTIAVITAAVEAFYGSKKVRIKDIRPVSSARSSWMTAGLMENIPAMRSEGLL